MSHCCGWTASIVSKTQITFGHQFCNCELIFTINAIFGARRPIVSFLWQNWRKLTEKLKVRTASFRGVLEWRNASSLDTIKMLIAGIFAWLRIIWRQSKFWFHRMNLCWGLAKDLSKPYFEVLRGSHSFWDLYLPQCRKYQSEHWFKIKCPPCVRVPKLWTFKTKLASFEFFWDHLNFIGENLKRPNANGEYCVSKTIQLQFYTSFRLGQRLQLQIYGQKYIAAKSSSGVSRIKGNLAKLNSEQEICFIWMVWRTKKLNNLSHETNRTISDAFELV